MQSVGITDMSIMKKNLGKISTGQLQRIIIAWSLADNPQVLLFDEPTEGIDIGGEETIYNLLRKIEDFTPVIHIPPQHKSLRVFSFIFSASSSKFLLNGGCGEVLNST